MVRHPGATLWAVVVGGGGADERGEVVLPMDALGHVRDAKLVGDAESRMLLQLLPGKLVRADIEPAPSLGEGDKAGDGHRPFDHRRQLVADAHILDIARLRAASLLRFVMGEDLRQVVTRVLHRSLGFDRFILSPALARSVAFGAKAPAIALGDQLAVAPIKFASIDLLDRAAGKTGLMLNQILQPDLGGELVPEHYRLMPDDVDPGEHRM